MSVAARLDLSAVGSLAQHLASSPVAFAVTEGPTHLLRYANDAFHALVSAGEIAIEQQECSDVPPNLAPLLNRAFHGVETLRDEFLVPLAGATARWSCTVWPLPAGAAIADGLVMEVRDAAYTEGAIARQRAIAERLLLGALREQDVARAATKVSHGATFLSAASRELATSLDEDTTRGIVRRSALPRLGTWCFVDVVESNGVVQRLAVVHPDPAKQALALTLAGRWNPKPGDANVAVRLIGDGESKPIVIAHDAGAALVAAAHGPENLAILRSIGFGALLVVPLVARTAVLGAITFVTPEGDAPLSPDEITLARDLADRCAMALDNARLYREADELRSTADAANRAKAEFLGNMSHELRTPLNIIGGYAGLMEMGAHGPITPEQARDLSRIQHSQQHLLTMISEILNFVRAESGRMEYHFSEIRVTSVLNDVMELLHGAVADRGLVLDCRPCDADAVMWADPDRVRQILMNLVMNAVKYSPMGGGDITLSSTMTPESVIIQVTDTGPGIPSEQLALIFEPFVQLASGLANRKGGVGLGLAISRDLARAMNGDLTASSTVGVGSRFTLELPRARLKSPEPS